eukprot:tig00001056_g6641.t1
MDLPTRFRGRAAAEALILERLVRAARLSVTPGTPHSHLAAVYDAKMLDPYDVLATADADGAIKLWRISGTTISNIVSAHAHQSAINCLDAVGDSLLSCGDDCSVRLHDVRRACEPTAVRRFDHHTSYVTGCCLDGTGDVAATAAMDGSVAVWHRSCRNPVFRIQQAPRATTATFVPGEGLHTLVTDSPLGAYVWDLRKAAERLTVLNARAEAERTRTIWDAADEDLNQPAPSPPGSATAAPPEEGPCTPRHAEGRGQAKAAGESPRQERRSSGGESASSGAASTAASFESWGWSAALGPPEDELREPAARLECAAVSTAPVFDKALKAYRRPFAGHLSEVQERGPGGKRRRKEVRVYSVAAGAGGPGGPVVMTGSEDGTVKLWELASRRGLESLEGLCLAQRCRPRFAFAARLVLCAGSDPLGKRHSLAFWRARGGPEPRGAEGNVFRSIGDLPEPVTCVAISADGSTLAAGDLGGSVHVWRA